MAKKSQDSLMEMETVIHWDETDAPMAMWTASPKVRKEWESYGFKPASFGGGWRVECPKSSISYKYRQKQA